MITILQNPNLRERYILSPWFRCLDRQIVVQVDKLVDVFNPDAGAWEEFPQAHQSYGHTMTQDDHIDLATLKKVSPDAQGNYPAGSVSVLGLMLTATAGQIGLTSLSEGAIYEAMATLIERFAQANGLVPTNPNQETENPTA